jgi:hypothetical protein
MNGAQRRSVTHQLTRLLTGPPAEQFITMRSPQFGSNQTCLEGYIIYCCESQFQDYSDSGWPCSEVCDDALKAILKDPDASKFTLTHTLWASDCSGHYRPFARSWDVTRRRPMIDLRPKLKLSVIEM